MKENEQWNESLSSSPFLKPHFSEQLKQEIMNKTKHRHNSPVRVFRGIAITAIIVLFGAAMLVTDLPTLIKQKAQTHTPDNVISQTWNVRTEYVKDGKTLFQVFTDPALIAGKSFGYMIHFTAPFETFSGKKIAIDAYNQEAGEQVTALSPQTITEPSAGYPGLQRFTTRFSLPLSGIWRFEVKLNNQFYGDFVLNIADPSSWTASPTFDLPYTGDDGKEYKRVFVGEKGKVGMLIGPYVNEKGELLNQQPIVARKMNKYMWHLWGSMQEVSGNFSVMAIKEGSRREIGLFNGYYVGGPDNGDVAQVPSSLELPDSGIWRLNAYIDHKLFGSIYVKVDAEASAAAN
jgi:hypothetical protein